MSRPWDKAVDRAEGGSGSKRPRPPPPPAAAANAKKEDEDDATPYARAEPPHVTVDGTKYYSDRFYLCRPSGLVDDDLGAASKPPTACTCGHDSPPPLIDRSRLVHNLVRGADGGGGLVAALLGTYTFDPYWMAHELPDLFPTAAEAAADCRPAIPTLVLHGHKGLRIYRRVARGAKRDDDQDDDAKIPAATKKEKEGGDGYDNENTVSNATKSTKAVSTKHPVVAVQTNCGSDEDENATDDEGDDLNNVKEEDQLDGETEDIPPEEGWRRESSLDSEEETTDDEDGAQKTGDRPQRRRVLADSVHVTEVLATWVPPRKANGPVSNRSGGTGAGRPSGTGSASSPVTLDDTSDEECNGPSGKNNVIVIDSSDDEEEDDDDTNDADTKVRIKQNADASISPPDNSNRTSDDGLYDSSLCVHPDIIQRREGRVGVHHPKFLLLFERRGSIVVVVTTTNLTRMAACEGMWVQRFEPRDLGQRYRFKSEDDTSPSGSVGVSTDFGRVLGDFLKRQSDASQANRITPDGFLRKFLRFPCGLEDFWNRYCFEEAQVHLIPTVPGDWAGPRRAQGKKEAQQTNLYGPQKVADILGKIRRKDKKLRKHGKPPSFISTNSDRLIIQATSFGGYWTRQNMEAICKSYLGPASLTSQVKGESNGDTDEDADSVSGDILDSLDIYWPTMNFFRSISQQKSKRRKLDDTEEEEIKDYAKHDPMKGFYCFHSSQNFNTNDLSVISRMIQYVPQERPQIPLALGPHIKTIARVLGDYYENDNRFEHSFSWFMLTSACLSRGAQGRIPEMRGFESDADSMSYTNWELGVMFCSSTGGRLYGFRPKECRCLDNAPDGFGNLVHLPVPYQLRASPYQPDEDEATMSETPFFHELTEGIGSAGHMGLTPLGRAINEKACKQK